MVIVNLEIVGLHDYGIHLHYGNFYDYTPRCDAATAISMKLKYISMYYIIIAISTPLGKTSIRLVTWAILIASTIWLIAVRIALKAPYSKAIYG
jgi:hypothetical protein